jgi:hypothetical protein
MLRCCLGDNSRLEGTELLIFSMQFCDLKAVKACTLLFIAFDINMLFSLQNIPDF